MQQFFKFVFASCLGVLLCSIVLFVLGISLVAGLAGSADKAVSVDPNSVLHLTFEDPIPEQTNNIEMNPFDLSKQKMLGLNDITATLEYAAGDSKIKGVFLNLDNNMGLGLAKADAIRGALLKFKESGKFVVAYSKYYTQGAYYLSSVADKVYVGPLGGIDFHGFSATIPFMKDMLDKIGVRMQIFYAGDFKSATEPYRLNEMSDQNRLQLREFLEPVYLNFLTQIGNSRNKTPAELRSYADQLLIGSSEDAVKYGLADQVGYIDEVIADMKERLGLKETDKLKTVSLEDYATSFTKKVDFGIKQKVAVIYAEGTILADRGDRGTIVDNEYIKTIRKIREDDNIKAIVLRVNSGGGSAIASENIWRELTLAKGAGKKIVVSMGDYAASGGYYIACMADKIVAEPNTLTGSIGVFSMIPNASKLFDEKLGIHFDSVLTTRNSVGINPFFDMSPAEERFMQQSTISTYETFLKRVSEGRNMSRDEVHKIAQGRVWVGQKAKDIGLVDEIGGLDRAVAIAVELASLDEYRIAEYPTQKEPLQELMEEITGQNDDEAIRSKILQKEMGGYYPIYKEMKSMMQMQGVQARLPYIIDFN